MDIGGKVKTLRQKRGITLKELADITGLSISFLSRLENDKTEATLNDLRKLADALETSIINFFPDDLNEDIRVVRSNQRRKIMQPAIKGKPSTLEFLLWGSKIQMEPTLMIIPSGSDSGNYAEHMGEEFLHVLEGDIKVFCGEAVYELHAGDTIGFPAKLPHRWENTGTEQAKVIVASSLPTF